MKYVVLIPTNKPAEMIEIVSRRGTITAHQLQKWVGGYFEYVNMDGGLFMAVNEDGWSLELPYNPYASVIVGQRILGPAVIFTSKGIEEVGMDEEIARRFME